jgi:DNA gyrase subunit B
VTYESENIRVLEGLEALRKRPTVYVGETNLAGVVHMAQEGIDNARDEHELPSFNLSEYVELVVCRHADNFTFCIKDYGRGIPLDSLVEVTTKLHASGKFDTTAYRTSGGLNGIGLKLITGLSEYAIITTTRQPDSAIIAFHKGEIIFHELLEDEGTETGTVVIFQPDKSIMMEVEEFLKQGPEILVERLNLTSILNTTKIRFIEVEDYDIRKLIKAIPKKPSRYGEYLFKIRQVPTEGKVLFEQSADVDPVRYLNQNFGNQSKIVWSLELEKTEARSTDRLVGYLAKLFLTENIKVNNKGLAGMINTIYLNEPSSYHFTVLNDAIKEMISPFIESKDVRDYFKTIYRLPLYACVKINYQEPQFVNQIKSAFRDKVFGEAYSSDVRNRLTRYPSDTWTSLYTYLEEDIVTQYNKHLSKDYGGNKKFKDLDVALGSDSKRFLPCHSNNPLERELFIVEGDSAFSQARRAANRYNQSVMALQGVPINGIQKTKKEFLNDRFIKNLITVLGISPEDKDLSKLNYHKIFFLSDADFYGYHINALMLNNAHLINPLLVTEGKLYVSSPPLYTVVVKNKSTLHFKDYRALLETKIDQVYKKFVHLFVQVRGGDTLLRVDESGYYAISYLIEQMGTAIKDAANTIGIAPVVFEVLLRNTYRQEDGTYEIDTDVVVAELQCQEINYNKDRTVMFLSVGDRDTMIPLLRYYDECSKGIYREYEEHNCRSFDIGMTYIKKSTKNDPPVLMHITKCLEIIEQLDKLLGKYKYFKGLGQMDHTHLKKTCFDPTTRCCLQITSPGDLDRMIALLDGDSSIRKALLR